MLKAHFAKIPGRSDALASTLTAVCGVFRWESGPFGDQDYPTGEILSSKASAPVPKTLKI